MTLVVVKEARSCDGGGGLPTRISIECNMRQTVVWIRKSEPVTYSRRAQHIGWEGIAEGTYSFPLYEVADL